MIHDRTKKELCHFDWLIATDRLSGSQYHRDLSDVSEFTTSVRKIKSVQSLTAMVVFESSLNINVDSVQFTGTNHAFGSLGWIARDSSKPGRKRKDGRECWVVQSHLDAASEIISFNFNL